MVSKTSQNFSHLNGDEVSLTFINNSFGQEGLSTTRERERGDSNSSILGGFSFWQEVRRSSEDNSPSLSDFHSAEEAPLEEPGTYGEKIPKTYKGNQGSSKTHARVSYAQLIYGIRDYL